MTDHTEERILLAEAMGYKTCSDGLWDGGIRRNGQGPIVLLPDPYTNPADTEAVMDWLLSIGWPFDLYVGKGCVSIQATEISDADYADCVTAVADDWKHAVTEVAVKVAREMR